MKVEWKNDDLRSELMMNTLEYLVETRMFPLKTWQITQDKNIS